GDPMIRMDALPPRIFEVTVDGVPFPDNGPFTSDSPTATAALVAKVRDEAGLRKTDLAERSVATGMITPLDSTLYSVAVSDTGRAHTLTASIRPRVGNYDLLVRSTDTNGREQTFALQVRDSVRYLANGVVIVNGTFVESNAVLRAEVMTPIPVTADSLTLLLDGVPLTNVTETALDATGRRWALVTLAEDRGPGVHRLDVEVNGRTGVFRQATFNVETSLALRRVVVVSPRLMGSGCDGSVFQFELSTPVPKVELLLMTVSGRRVASAQWPGKAGFNVYCWDGRDSQGNTTATGLYFYRLTAVDAAGHKASQSGRMIRTR
ncbi:MAG TPA: FlgD immunoglobulin-like domain containing protein, partial [Candidatus Eisenbacteria bacterium]